MEVCVYYCTLTGILIYSKLKYNQLSTIEISTVRPSMGEIPYLIDFLDLGNEAHLRPV